MCSVTCGNGSKSRSRTCPVVGACSGRDNDKLYCRERYCRKRNFSSWSKIWCLFKLLGRSGILGLYALWPVVVAQKKELGLVRFQVLAEAKIIKREVVRIKNAVSYICMYFSIMQNWCGINYWWITQFLANNVPQWNRNDRTEPWANQGSKSADFQVVKQGFIPYGPANPNHSCSMSKGGALSYNYKHKKYAKDDCEDHGCDIIIELSHGRFEVGLTTSMNRCDVQRENIKQQWIKL